MSDFCSRPPVLHASDLDLDAAQAWMADICGPHSLRASAEQPLEFEHSARPLNGGSTLLGRIQYGTDVVISIDGSHGLKSYSISLPLDGEQALQRGRQQVRSDARSGLIVSPFDHQQLNMAANCRKLQVVIDCKALHRVLEYMLLRPVSQPLVFEPRIDAQEGSGAGWWRLARYVMAEIETPQPLFDHATLAQDLEHTLIKGLILAQPNNYSNALAGLGTAHVPSFVHRARQFIEDNAQSDLRLADIEAAAGVSSQRLHEGFKQHCGLTPVAWLKRYRLYGARRSLLENAGGYNVAAIASQWGFSHLGRFAAQYAQAFGEAPSRTLWYKNAEAHKQRAVPDTSQQTPSLQGREQVQTAPHRR